jgi:uncharacterized membrane protein
VHTYVQVLCAYVQVLVCTYVRVLIPYASSNLLYIIYTCEVECASRKGIKKPHAIFMYFVLHIQTWATSSGTRPSHVSSPFVCHRVSCKFSCILFYTYTQTWATSSGTRPSHVSSPCCEESPEAPAEDRRSKPPALLPLAFLLPPATSVTLSLPSACVCVRACMCTRVCCMRV